MLKNLRQRAPRGIGTKAAHPPREEVARDAEAVPAAAPTGTAPGQPRRDLPRRAPDAVGAPPVAAGARRAPPMPERMAQRPPQVSGEGEGSRLIVGRDIQVKGEIACCDTLVVEGRVEASMDSRVIRIAERGVFMGKVGVDTAEIHGRFDGELSARRRLIIHPTGRLSGIIRYGAIQIEEGGQITGDIGVLAQSEPAAAPTEAPQSDAREAPTEQEQPAPPARAAGSRAR